MFFFCMRVLVTSANAPTSLEYGASGDMVFLCSFCLEGEEVFLYICVLTFIVSSGIQCRDRFVWLLVCMFFFHGG